MHPLTELFSVTKKLYDHVQEPLPKGDERDRYIEIIAELLQRREELIPQVGPPKSDQEERIARTLLDYNRKLTERLTIVMREVGQDLNQIRKKKSTGKQYENPYNNRTQDGVFFDSKK